MYKAPERRELTEEERIAVANGAVDPRDAEEAGGPGGIAGTGITVFAQVRAASDAAPPPPPETFGAYTKKSGKSNGVQCFVFCFPRLLFCKQYRGMLNYVKLFF